MGISYIEMNEQKIPIEDEELRGVVPTMEEEINDCVRTLGYTVSKNYLPNNNVTHTGGGLTFTVNADKTVTVNGKGTSEPWTNIYFMGNYGSNTYVEIKGLKDGVDYIYSCCPSGASGDTYQGHLFVCDENNNTTTLRDNGEGVTFTHKKGYRYIVSAGFKYNYQADNVILKPMISKEGGEYEPYVEDVQTQIDDLFTRKVYTITLSTNSHVSPFTMFAKTNIANDVSTYGVPIAIYGFNDNQCPVSVAYREASKELLTASSMGTAYVYVIYSKVIGATIS